MRTMGEWGCVRLSRGRVEPRIVAMTSVYTLYQGIESSKALHRQQVTL